MRSNVRYMRFQTPQGIGYGCFYLTWEREENKLLHFKVGAAFCSPKDRFVKSIANRIAVGRHDARHIFGLINSTNTGYITEEDFETILYYVFGNQHNEIPKWAYKAYFAGKYSLTLSLKRIMGSFIAPEASAIVEE
jgi:hypothetical protein